MKQYKRIIFLFLFFVPALCLAQYDTARLSDSLGPTIYEEQVETPPPAVDDSYQTYDSIYKNDHDDEQDEKQYFLYKWEAEDSFSVLQRMVPGDRLKKMQDDDDFWYANSEVKHEKSKTEKADKVLYTPVGKRSWFQAVLWIVIIGAFAVLLLIYLSKNIFSNKTVALTGEPETDEIPEDIFAINYQKEIDKAAANSNYRLAIRLMFLRLLKQMSERNIIQYKQDRTNFDYLVQLQPTGYYNDFFRITRNYEYSWYGKFPLSEDAYKSIRGDFARFDRQLYQG